MGFLFAVGIISGWILIEYGFGTLHQDHVDYEMLRFGKFIMCTIWFAFSAYLVPNSLGTVLWINLGLCALLIKLSINPSLRTLYFGVLNLMLLALLLVPAVNTGIFLQELRTILTHEEYLLVLLFAVECAILTIYFISSSRDVTIWTSNQRLLLLISNKALLIVLGWYYVRDFAANSSAVETYLWIQLELATLLGVVTAILFDRAKKSIRIGLALTLYGMLTLANIIFLHVISFWGLPTDLFRYCFIGVIGGWMVIMAAQTPQKFAEIGSSTQQILTLLVCLTGFSTIYFLYHLVGAQTSISTELLVVYYGLLLIGKLLHRDRDYAMVYAIFSQALWIAVIWMIFFGYHTGPLFWLIAGGLILNLVTDLFHVGRISSLPVLLWSYGLGLPLLMPDLFGFLPVPWYISPILLYALFCGIALLLIKLHGHLHGMRFVGKAILLGFFPVAIMTFYQGTVRGWIPVPSTIPYFLWIIYGILGFGGFLCAIVIAIKSKIPTIQMITMEQQKRLDKAQAKSKSS
jgi:hypothetical protein